MVRGGADGADGADGAGWRGWCGWRGMVRRRPSRSHRSPETSHIVPSKDATQKFKTRIKLAKKPLYPREIEERK